MNDESRPQQAAPGNVHLSATIPPLAVGKPTAADLLGMSVDSLERHVLPELRVVRLGRLVHHPRPGARAVPREERRAVTGVELETLETVHGGRVVRPNGAA